jgi:hypothetical protein
METHGRWVLLAYRLPREPSTPRIALWRKLKRLGAAQVLDSLVGLPLTPRNREQLEWLADEVLEAGGEASLWLAEPVSAAQQRELEGRLSTAVAEDYRALTAVTHTAHAEPEPSRRRTLGRLRREFRRITERDYFPPPEREEARVAVEALAEAMEVPSCSGQPARAVTSTAPPAPG